MIVLDASAAIDWLLQTDPGQRIENRIYSRGESLHAPHLLDLEVAQVLRRLVREASVSAERADQAIQDLLDLRLTRSPHFIFLPHIWQLRHNFSAYDAAYL
ncbi:MAG: type II toxin-antitoxin system VapC family toxin, partial [Candidatus Sulfotelmatobacter sp.]